MNATAERPHRGAVIAERAVSVLVPPAESQIPMIRHMGRDLLNGYCMPGMKCAGHPRTRDVLEVVSEYGTNAVRHGSRAATATIHSNLTIWSDGSVAVVFRNELGPKRPSFIRLCDETMATGPIEVPNLAASLLTAELPESGFGLRCVVHGSADLWNVEVKGNEVIATAEFVMEDPR